METSYPPPISTSTALIPATPALVLRLPFIVEFILYG